MAAAPPEAETTMSEAAYVDLHKPAVIIGGCSVGLALILSLFLILQHLRHYTNRAEQKWVVAVLFMVPVYATDSIISLWNSKLSLPCDILRNCYEAIALYAFGRYMISCLGGENQVVEFLEEESRKQLQKKKPLLDGSNEDDHRSFWNFFRHPCLIGKKLLVIEKFGLVQYMILKTVCAFLAMVLAFFGVYGDGEFKWNYGYPYIAVVLNFSQMWALYCLVQFYNVTHERLKPIKPLAKFISFKAIVFATWWQGVGIALLCTFKVLPKRGRLQTGLQDFLICIEMAVAAIAHVFVFSIEPYRYYPTYYPTNEYEEVVSDIKTETVKLDEHGEEETTLVEKTETKVEVPGTSVKESVQDIIVEGGQRVFKDVVLTINQTIHPVEKGVTKIHERFHHRSEDSAEGDHKEVDEVEYVREDSSEGEATMVSIESETVDKT